MLREFITRNIVTKILKSFRGGAVLSGILTVVFQDALGLSPEATMEITGLIIALVFGDTVRPKE